MKDTTRLYAWVNEIFSEDEFTIDEFDSAFSVPDPTEAIQQLLDIGYICEEGSNRYRALAPNELLSQVSGEDVSFILRYLGTNKEAHLLARRVIKDGDRVHGIVKNSSREYAYSRDSALGIWASESFREDMKEGLKPIHVDVLKDELDYWKNFFRRNDVMYGLAGEEETLFGHVYIIHPKEELQVVEKEGDRVVPLSRTVSFCRKTGPAYRAAYEHLVERYEI